MEKVDDPFYSAPERYVKGALRQQYFTVERDRDDKQQVLLLRTYMHRNEKGLTGPSRTLHC
jgi:hypothetical protein